MHTVALLRLALLVVFAAFVAGFGTDQALGQALQAAGDGRNIWTALPDAQQKTITLMHRIEADPAGRLERLATLRGRLTPNGIAAANDRLWMVYEDRSVQSLRYDPADRTTMGDYDLRVEPSLPLGTEVLSMTAGGVSAFVLLRVEDKAVLELIDSGSTITRWHSSPQQGSVKAHRSTKSDPLPASPTTAPATAQTAEKSAETAAKTAENEPVLTAGHTERLLRLDRNGWTKLALPEDWPESFRYARLVTPAQGSDWPTLIVEPRLPVQDRAVKLQVYRVHTSPDQPLGRWVRHEHALTLPEDVRPDFQAAVVEGQVAVGYLVDASSGPGVLVALLRTGAVQTLGTIPLHDKAVSRWRLMPAGQSIAAVGLDTSDQLIIKRMDLRGRVAAGAPVQLKESIAQPLLQSADYFVLIVVLASSTVMLMLFWKRQADDAGPHLPKGMELADIARVAAGLVDLLPCMFLAAKLTEIDLTELYNHWPGRAGGWHATEPGFLTLGLYVAHTMIFELLFSRSLGKMLFGLRLVNDKGQRPRPLAVFIRNIMKPMDLIAWPLMLLPIVGNSRQRLGDLVAGTYVVNTRGERDEEENERDQPED